MFPHGCPSYQKAFVKLFRVEKGKQSEVLKLIDTQYFNNRDGFGFVLSNLTKGDYQLHFKKYSTGFDVFDFTARIYADRMIKLIDDDDEHLKKVQLSKEMMDKIPSIKDQDKKEQKDEKDKAGKAKSASKEESKEDLGGEHLKADGEKKK